MLKSLLYLSFLFFLCSSSFAQNDAYQKPFVLNSGGANVDTVNYHVSFSIGEIIVETIQDNEEYIVTRGYLQPYFNIPQIATFQNDTLFCKNDLIQMSSLTTENYPLTWLIDGQVVAENTSNYSFLFDQEPHTIIAYSKNFPKIEADTFHIYFENPTRCGVDLIVYELITPNADEKNDYFYVENIHKLVSNEVYLFNRWGNLLFFQKNYENTYSPNDLEAGEYMYVVKDKDRNRTYTGNLIIQK